MSTSRRFPSLITLAVVFFSFSDCLSQVAFTPDAGKTFSLENSKYASLVVASIAGHPITAQEFLLNYEFGPAFPKRDKNSKEEYLNYMIYEKLLALDGYNHHIDTTNDARISLAEMEGDLATEELYKRDVLAKVKISERAINAGIRQENTQCSVEWIYSESKNNITAQYTAILNGVAFDSLFRIQFRDTSVTQDNRSMDMSRFQIGMRNPDLARVLDTLQVQHVSEPIHTSDGYYLMFLTKTERNLMVTQTQEAKLHEDVKQALVQHLADSLSDQYVRDLMRTHHPTIVKRTLDILHVHLAKIMVTEVRFESWNLVRRLIERWGPVQYESIDGSLPLVEAKGAKFTTQDFLAWYRAREVNLKFSLSSPEAMFASLEGYIWQMVRDKLLTRRAFQRGFQRMPRVRAQLGWWKDKIVYNIVKARMEDSLHPTDQMLKLYYEQHQRDFRDTSGSMIPFDHARDDVLRQWLAFESMKMTVHRILKLKEQYRIVINKPTLNNLYVDTENDPRVIDVYVAKPGGIFPRPAFPTIDYDWQTWN